jgi:hypothetical protein
MAQLKKLPPGFGADPEGAWEQLEHRLAGRNKVYTGWWRWAAVLLTVAALGAWFYSVKDDAPVVENKPLPRPAEFVNGEKALVIKTNTIAQPSRAVQATTARAVLPQRTDSMIVVVESSPDTTIIIEPVVTIPALPTVTTPKKLKVVHLNELYDFQQEKRESFGNAGVPSTALETPGKNNVFPYFGNRKNKQPNNN